MSGTQQFIIELLKAVTELLKAGAPYINKWTASAFLIGWHLKRPFWMNGKVDNKPEDKV